MSWILFTAVFLKRASQLLSPTSYHGELVTLAAIVWLIFTVEYLFWEFLDHNLVFVVGSGVDCGDKLILF